MHSSKGRKPSRAHWCTPKGWRGDLSSLQEFTVHSFTQGDIDGALAQFEGSKEHVFNPSLLQGPLMRSNGRRVNWRMLKGWRKIIRVFEVCSCTQGRGKFFMMKECVQEFQKLGHSRHSSQGWSSSSSRSALYLRKAQEHVWQKHFMVGMRRRRIFKLIWIFSQSKWNLKWWWMCRVSTCDNTITLVELILKRNTSK